MNTPNEQLANHAQATDVSILVVDDSPTLLHAICSLLEFEKGIEIVGKASDGQEAIEAVAGLHPEFVLMDVAMPRMNGLVATRFLTRHFPDAQVFLMSSEESPCLREECLACGAIVFIYKPRFRKELLAAIQATRKPVKIDVHAPQGRAVFSGCSWVAVGTH